MPMQEEALLNGLRLTSLSSKCRHHSGVSSASREVVYVAYRYGGPHESLQRGFFDGQRFPHYAVNVYVAFHGKDTASALVAGLTTLRTKLASRPVQEQPRGAFDGRL